MSSLKIFLCLLSCLTTAYGTGIGIHYTILDRSRNNPGDKHTNEIDLQEAYRILRGATEFVLGSFDGEELGNVTIRKYNRVVLITQSFEEHHMPSYAYAVASTTRNVILLNSDYLQHYNGDVKEEFTGILYHETTRVWQNDGNRKAPAGLVNGIADYMRMKAGFPSKGWPARGSGSRWDQGYAVTAYFLEYCDGLSPGDNFVGKLNAMMKHSYSDEYFFRLLGRSVYELWSNYLNSYRYDVGEVRPTTLEESVNEKSLPRPSDEAVEITKEGGGDSSDCFGEMMRGMMRMINNLHIKGTLSKEDGYETA